MDARNFSDEMRGQTSLSIPAKNCDKIACSGSDMTHDTSTSGLSARKYAYTRPGAVHNAYACGMHTDNALKSVESQTKSIGNQMCNEDGNVPSPTTIDGCAYEARKKLRVNVSPPLAPKGLDSEDALAGLIFMSNDKVRRSYFKYHVLGMPASRKHVVDRVKIGTKLFLFEFESRQLWGIYEATSETSLDIEKDAYQASSAPLPVQVRFRVVKKCRPLPERLFKQAIQENYFTSIKFNSELTVEQVSKLIQLYDLQAVGDLKPNVTTIFAPENSTHSKNDRIDAPDNMYNGSFSAEHMSIPHKRRFMDRHAHDSLEMSSLNSDQMIQNYHIQRHVPLHMARPDIGFLFNPDMAHLRLGAKSTACNSSDLQDEALQADNANCRNGKADFAPYTGKTTLKSKRQGMTDNVQILPSMGFLGGSSSKPNIQRSLERPVNDGCLLCELNVRPLGMQKLRKFCKEPDRNEHQYPCGHGDPRVVKSGERETLPGNMKVIASPSVCIKCLSHDLHPASGGKNNGEQYKAPDRKDKRLCGQDDVLSYRYLYDSLPGQNSRQHLGIKGSPLLMDVVQEDARLRARDENLASASMPGHPIEKSSLVLVDPEVHHGRELRNSVLHMDDSSSMPMSMNAAKLSWPDDDAWLQDHAKCLSGNRASCHPSTSKTLDGKAWPDHQMSFPDLDHGNKSLIDGFTCITRQNKPSKNDTIQQDRNLEQIVNGSVTHDHLADDDEAWLERARSIVLQSLKARSNDIIIGDADRSRDEDAYMQLDQMRHSQLQVLGKRPRLDVCSDLPMDTDNEKPRGSVWSRLSFPRKTHNSMEAVLPDARMSEP